MEKLKDVVNLLVAVTAAITAVTTLYAEYGKQKQAGLTPDSPKILGSIKENKQN